MTDLDGLAVMRWEAIQIRINPWGGSAKENSIKILFGYVFGNFFHAFGKDRHNFDHAKQFAPFFSQTVG